MVVEQSLAIMLGVAILYGLFNMFTPIMVAGIPSSPFPFQPSYVVWFDREVSLVYAYDPISRIFHEPDWLAWSLSLYLGTIGLLALGLQTILNFRTKDNANSSVQE